MSLPKSIPIFPLPQVVFFPKTYLPLHIFERRYREMVRHAWEGDRIIGMALLQEGWEADYEGRPPVYAVGCAGTIMNLQTLEDGRSNLILHGLKRFNILEEHGQHAFREVLVDWLSDQEVGCSREMVTTLLNRVEELSLKQPDLKGIMDPIARLDPDPAALIHTLSFMLPLTPYEKQFLLESESLLQQARRLLDLLSFESFSSNHEK